MAKDKSSKNLTMVPATEESIRDQMSPYLKFQDKNGDGMPDVCDDVTPPAQKCRQCIPNPYSIISNWRNRNQLEPILNEKSCKYQITFVTPETTTGFVEGMTEEEAAEMLKGMFKRYEYQAIQALLEHFQKDDSMDSVLSMTKVVDYTDYYLEARTGSRLKLLYSLEFDDVFALPPLKQEYSDEDEFKPDPEDIEVTLMAKDLNTNIVKLRKTLDLYNRYLKVFRATEGGNLKFKKDDRIFNLGNYGDDGLFGKGALADTYNQLDNWLAARGYTLGVSFFDMFSSDELITKMNMVFTADYKIKLLEVFTMGCRDRPAARYRNRRLATLRRNSGWRDKTAVAFFAHQNGMMRDAESRKPMPWIEYLEKYTYPTIYAFKPEGPIGKPTISDCIANNLENEFKELGQDIFDEVFGIGDAIAKQFHEALCRSNPDEVKKDLADQGLSPGTTFTDLYNMQMQAMNQAYMTVEEKDNIFELTCRQALGLPIPGMAGLDKLYTHGLDPMKHCGLFDLMLEAMDCLMKGLSLQEALGRIVLVTLKAMGVEDFGALFVGLPPEKRAELDALVRKNLKEGKMFEGLSDRSPRSEGAPFFGGIGIEKPWENEQFVAHQKAIERPGPFGGNQPSKNPGIVGFDPTQERRTLAEKIQGPSASEKSGLDPNVILEAYVLALVEVYEDNLLSLLDVLSTFPGAQLISAVIALFDCPTPPLFNPGVMDFIKSLTLPFCRNPTDIVAIRMENPFRAWPKLSDILQLIFWVLKKILIFLLVKILYMILSKICEIIGDAICKALETVGAVAGSLPDLLSGRASLYGVIRESICGPGASDEQVEDTVVSLVEQLGVGGAALADRETAINFFADSINTMTREETFEAFLSGPSNTALEMMDNLIEFDYPEYRDAFPNKSSLSSFFKNVGVLIPAQLRSDMRGILASFPEETGVPANPTMCATPEELDLFEQRRCALLEGRMSPAQCEALNESAKGQLLDDLEDVANTLQMGLPNLIEANMPPVFSDPGCDNGMLPYEPEQLREAALLGVEGDTKRMEATFASDMLGDGGFFSSQKDWGFMNMVLSDTYGNPWTVHQDKVANGAEWVSYYGELTGEDPLGPPSPPSNPFKIPLWLVGFLAWIAFFPLILFIYLIDLLFFSSRRGAYPKWVGGFLRQQFNPTGNAAQGGGSDLRGLNFDFNSSMTFKATNDRQPRRNFNRSFDSLGFDGFFWDTDVELVHLADYGYNVTARADFGSNRVRFTKLSRKRSPNITMTFRDNGKGYFLGPGKPEFSDSKWNYGYQVNAYYADLYEKGENNKTVNRPDDNIRVKIIDATNLGGAFNMGNATLTDDQQNDFLNKMKSGDKIIQNQRFEFLSVDDGLEGLNTVLFPKTARHFEDRYDQPPQVSTILDLCQLGGQASAFNSTSAEAMYNRVNQQFFDDFANEIYSNPRGWLFGASFPNYTRKDFEYGVTLDPELEPFNRDKYNIGDWVPWWDLNVSSGPIWASDDQFLGISYDAHKNRENPENISIFYLEPSKYGGNYTFPPVYAKPPPNTGWVGLLDVMFPERSPSTCKVKTQGMAEFADVQKMVRDTYASLSEDGRLTGDPDCTREVPFDRILPRTGKAALRGIIMSGIRCFVNVELMKGLGTFATFAPKFEENYSKVYAGYIVEIMKEACMSTGGNFLNPFKDDEFWYAFLEMSVQFYIDRLDDFDDEFITLDNMPEYIRTALERIDKLQKTYKYPWDFDDFNSEDYGTFESMKSFRESKNLEAVKRVESEAKLVLQELVFEQMIAVGDLFIKNAHRGGLTPTHYNMNYFFYNKYCAGGENLKLYGEHKSVIKPGALPTEGSNHYSTGDQLALPDGTPYVGEYHTHYDVDGELIYMAGREHSADDEHDRLIPFAEKLEVVSIRQVEEFDDSEQPTGRRTITQEPLGDIPSTVSVGDKDFYLKKYILINGEEHPNDVAVSRLRNQIGRISQLYPGTLGVVREQIVRDGNVVGEGKVVGITGNIGVQYALEFGMVNKGTGATVPVAVTTIDALDLPCNEFRGIEANSKILLCLIQQLENEPRFKLVTQYIFSMKKALSLLAIYNGLGLTPSIGEWVTPSGTLNSPKFPSSISDLAGGDGGKPGVHLKGAQPYYDDEDEVPKVRYSVESINGWLSDDDRNGWFTSFGFLDYDEWDQEVLRNSTKYMKNAFRTHYRNRKWTKPDYGDRDPLGEWLNGIIEKFRFNPAYKVLPAFSKKRARGNVFDANGNECSKKG
jgi:hypothetical protein